MPIGQKNIYCLYVETKKESYVENFLRRERFSVIPALAERKVWKGKNIGYKKTYKPLIPGYVFFEADAAPEWERLDYLPAIYYPLSYADNSRALRGRDLEFIKSLTQNGGVFKISRVYAGGLKSGGLKSGGLKSEDTKIKVIDGFLKGLEGNIIKVNRRKGWVIVRVSGDAGNIIGTIKVGIEFIEEV